MGTMTQALDEFAAASRKAVRHRKLLRQKFGLTDEQIGWMVRGRSATKSLNYLSDYTAAVIAAKKRLDNK
jgi:hypothetical protein